MKEWERFLGRKNFFITKENVAQASEKNAEWIQDYLDHAGTNIVYLGMSGGIDCTTVALQCLAAKVDLRLVLMPYKNNMYESGSCERSMTLIEEFNFPRYQVIDIAPQVDLTIEAIFQESKTDERREMLIAYLAPIVRMQTLYGLAWQNRGLVIGTGNLAERLMGYFNKTGDGLCDLNPLGMFLKREVRLVANYRRAPQGIILAPPSADLKKGQIDEIDLKVTYDQIDDFVTYDTSGDSFADAVIIETMRKNAHKHFKPMFNEIC